MTEGSASPRTEPKKKKESHFLMVLTVLEASTIGAAGVLWEVYGQLPPQYYFPISITFIVLLGVIAYVFLSRTIDIS
jgi:hypothetical protein